MFEIGAVDLTAESRQRLVSLLHSWIHSATSSSEIIPQLSIRSVSPDEVKFQSGLDLCVVGPEFLYQDIARIGPIKKYLNDVPLVCVCDARASTFVIADQVARLGAEDIFKTDGSGAEFLTRVLFLTRRRSAGDKGKLFVVESGKGGTGVTSIAAGLAESLVDRGRTVCLVDGDFQSQDLSRFLLVKPYVNESLELILTGQRGVNGESVSECLKPVWTTDDGLYIVTPPPQCLSSENPSSIVIKVFSSFIDALRSRFDCVVLDTGHLSASILRPLYSSSMHLIFVSSGDPAGFPAAGIKLSGYSGILRRDTEITLVMNGTDYDGLSGRLALHELKKLVAHDSRTFHESSVPSCRKGRQWPASGRTLYSHSTRLKRAFAGLGELAAGSRVQHTDRRSHSFFTPYMEVLRGIPARFKRAGKNSRPTLSGPQKLIANNSSAETTLSQLVSQPQFVD